ncbi:MAG: hypothetical protein M5U34_15775 [Chloroflexi bacterium]|nr:hypothetical protein [Chloroflexota bacterium]
MKTVWHSGYQVTLSAEKLRVQQPLGEDIEIVRGNNVAVLAWYFKLVGYKRGGRERRVAKDWLCFLLPGAAGRKPFHRLYLCPAHPNGRLHPPPIRSVSKKSTRLRSMTPPRTAVLHPPPDLIPFPQRFSTAKTAVTGWPNSAVGVKV